MENFISLLESRVKTQEVENIKVFYNKLKDFCDDEIKRAIFES